MEHKEDIEENQDKVEDLEEIEKVNPEDILQEEEIDKNAQQNKMEIDDNAEIENENYDNFEENEGEHYAQEFPDFSAPGEIYSIALQQEKGIAIIGDGEDTTTFYDIANKKIISSQKLNKDSVNFIKFSNDNKFLITASIDGSINIFDGSDFKLLNTIKDQDAEINWVDWHPKGNAFSFGTSDGSVWVYMANKISNTFSFFSHTASTTCGYFSKDGKNLISGGEDCTLRVYDLKNQSLLNTIRENKGKQFHKRNIICITLNSTKPIVASGSEGNELALTNYENGNILFYTSLGDENISIETIAFCNEDKYVVMGDSNNKLSIFDISGMQIRAVVNLESDNITKIVPSLIRPYEIYASGSTGEMYIFDTRGTGSIIQKEKVHSDVIMDFVLTKDEQFILTSSLDKKINLLKMININ